MTRKDREKFNQCLFSGCKYLKLDCLKYHGDECKRIDGNKIPQMRLIEPEQRRQLQPRPNVPVSTFKPYFMGTSNLGQEDEPLELYS